MQKSAKVCFFLFTLFLLALWWVNLFFIGNDVDQGSSYRILFVHVPVAWSGLVWILWAATCGLGVLVSRRAKQRWDNASQAAMELGGLCAFLVLATGSLWGRATWGVWWDWDPRLTSCLVLFLLCCGYWVLRQTTPEGRVAQRVGAVLALLTALNVPIVYFSVNLWRSIHQPQTFVVNNTQASRDITWLLVLNTILLFALTMWIYRLRKIQLRLQDEFLEREEEVEL